MFRSTKGEYGYINKRKYGQLGLAVLMGIIGLSIYGIGYIVNGFERNNICMVLGILMVLPGAKFLVTYILLFPYHTPNKELYQETVKTLQGKQKLLSDLVITSKERAMNLHFLYVGNGCVYGLLGREGTGVKEVQDYLTKGIRNWAGSYTVKIMDRETSFFKILHEIPEKEMNKEEEERVLAYIYSLIV
ncbi:MAG: hypothetical protein RR056_05670 [Acetivibrio sp.]